jgi:glycosyltransferase involved in cell wall biosynthesis
MNKTASLLIMIHCEQFTGYAVGVLEQAFFDAAKNSGYKEENIFWSYTKVTKSSSNIIECQYNNGDNYTYFSEFIVQHNIQQVLAFDLGYPAHILSILRSSGVRDIVSYWGASMSSINSGLKLAYKKLEWALTKDKPTHFIFESEAMRLTATQGRGIPKTKTSVISLGVDTEKFTPDYQKTHYAHQQLGIPIERKIIFYSGHMEERKGVRVIIQAAIDLIEKFNKKNIHFVICGNKNNDADVYNTLLENTQAKQHVTFAGYRSDIADLMRSSSVGVIASTGWDSFTMSSVEMMASGLPLIVSNLQGLGETIEHNTNGFHINPGDFKTLAQNIITLTTDVELAKRFSRASRQRAEVLFSRKRQTELISQILTRKK